MAPEDVSASPSVHVVVAIDVPKAHAPTVLPAVVTVNDPLAAENPKRLVFVQVIPAEAVKEPKIENDPDPARVPVNPAKVMLRQAAEEIVQVTAPDAPSKNTSSEDVGTAWPPAPPEVNAHLVPAVPSQFAVPPTQYLSLKIILHVFPCFWAVGIQIHMAWAANSAPIVNLVPQVRESAPRLNVVSFQVNTTNAAALASPVVAGKYSSPPVSVWVALHFALALFSCPAHPKRVVSAVPCGFSVGYNHF
jgi:hypothetical protein